ncbi:hypothetical protein RND81_05G257300 [Saponaria officinalis]|uniref:Chlororespiratory reduction 42 n=1 Tax=Saponaria officinalis TaxID=3572 RepID=A0AAW1L1D5_SAPOF
MFVSLSSTAYKPFSSTGIFSRNQRPNVQFRSVVTRCEVNEQPLDVGLGGEGASKLSIGSPIVITEAPKMLKTAASVPCLRVNSGLVNPGDVGRIVSRKPMNVWAIRLSIGTYLVDEKYFKPLQLEE